MPSKSLQSITEPLAVSPIVAASLISSTVSSLEKDRAVGHLGIPYVKAGKRIFYCVSDLKNWLQKNKVIEKNSLRTELPLSAKEVL